MVTSVLINMGAPLTNDGAPFSPCGLKTHWPYIGNALNLLVFGIINRRLQTFTISYYKDKKTLKSPQSNVTEVDTLSGENNKDTGLETSITVKP